MSRIIKSLEQAVRYAHGDKSAGRSTMVEVQQTYEFGGKAYLLKREGEFGYWHLYLDGKLLDVDKYQNDLYSRIRNGKYI